MVLVRGSGLHDATAIRHPYCFHHLYFQNTNVCIYIFIFSVQLYNNIAESFIAWLSSNIISHRQGYTKEFKHRTIWSIYFSIGKLCNYNCYVTYTYLIVQTTNLNNILVSTQYSLSCKVQNYILTMYASL